MPTPNPNLGQASGHGWGVLDTLADAYLVVDHCGLIQHRNKAAQKWLESMELGAAQADLATLLREACLAESALAELRGAMRELRPWSKVVALRLDPSQPWQDLRLRLHPLNVDRGKEPLFILQAHRLQDVADDFQKREQQNRANLVLDLLGTTLTDLEYPLGSLRWLASLPTEEFARIPDDLRTPMRSVQKAARHIGGLFRDRDLSLPEEGEEVADGSLRVVRVLVSGSTPTRAAQLLDSLRSEGLRCVFRSVRSREELVRIAVSGEVDALLLDRFISAEKAAEIAVTVAEVEPRLPVISCEGLDVEELAVRLQAAMERSRMVGASDEVWRRIEEIALRDSLTGVLNRRAFERFASQEFDRAQRYDFPASLALFDLDHFKMVNDRLGHPAGDRLLQIFASYLQTATRQSDLIARIGGDEFAVLMSHTDGTGALVLTQRLRDAAELHIREVMPPLDPPVGVSVGLAVFPNEQVGSFEDLVARADEALLHAKDGGKGRLQAIR